MFEPKTAFDMAVLSDQAYLHHTFSRNESQVLIETDEKGRLSIVFRGTEPTKIKDLATDIKFKKVSTPLGLVHRGFWQAFNEVWPDIWNLVQETDAVVDDLKIICAGHSLGAALATICAAVLHNRGYTVDAVYTIGSPRVFDDEGTEKYNHILFDRTFRMVHNNDFVTRIPTRSMGYSHVGQFIYIDHDGLVHQGDITPWEVFWDRVEGRLEDLFDLDLDGIEDHGRQYYIDAIKPGPKVKLST